MKIKNYIRIVLWLIMLIGGAVISIHFDKIYFPEIFSNTYFHFISFIIGYFLLKFVLKASRNTGRFLARLGREGEISRLETNKLVVTGRYAMMRHPMHFGLLFFPLAFALLIGSPTFILFLAPIEMILMVILIKLWEEPEAMKKFGDEYIEYKKRVPFFCFKLHCIQELLREENE